MTNNWQLRITSTGAHVFLLTCILLDASVSHGQALTCTDSKDGPILSNAAAPENVIFMNIEHLTCVTGITFIPSGTDTNNGFLLIHPVEPGLNAQYIVYYASFKKGKYRHIGELPVSSERNDDVWFINIFQQGGSIYMENYKLTPTKVEKPFETLELLMDGIVCVQNPSDVWQTALERKRACGEKKNASFHNPICLLHKDGKTVLSHLSICETLRETR